MRLIDSDVLPKHEIKDEKAYINPSYARGWNDAIRSVYLYAPKIEAEPVRRGKWEGLYNQYDAPYSVCSFCKSKTYRAVWVEGDGSIYGKKTGYAYCPNCGAKMEEVI